MPDVWLLKQRFRAAHSFLMGLIREKPRHPARSESCGKRKPKRCPGRVRNEHALLQQPAGYAPCCTLGGAQQWGDFTSRKFPAIEDRFEQLAGPLRQLAERCLFLGPDEYAGAQPVRLHQLFHERYLIHAGLEKELREFGERFLAEITPSVKIVAALQVAVCE